MKASQFFISTLKEAPTDAEIVSHKLMMRAGLIKKLGAGLYNYMPMGLRTIRKVEQIIREEINRAGAVELTMPVIQPAELWQETGRFDKMGPELLRLKDRHDRSFVIGPTHEEVITATARANGAVFVGPNTPGLISPGKAKMGFMPSFCYTQGNVGVISRSGSLSYEACLRLTTANIGQSTVIGIGGDPVKGLNAAEAVELLHADADTDAILYLGEIGGNDEYAVARYAARAGAVTRLIGDIAGMRPSETKTDNPNLYSRVAVEDRAAADEDADSRRSAAWP